MLPGRTLSVGGWNREGGTTTVGTGGGGEAQFTATGLPLWTAAVRAMQAGTRNAKLCLLGDSTTAGRNSVVGDGGVKSQSPGYVMASLLTASGIPASARSFNGSQNVSPATRVAGGTSGPYDPTITFEDVADWTLNQNTLGGQCFVSTPIDTANQVNFQPVDPVDTFTVYVPASSSGTGSLIVCYIDDVEVAQISGHNATSIMRTSTFNVALGVHKFSFSKAGSTNIAGVSQIIAYNSAQKEVSVYVAGASGYNASQIAGVFAPSSSLPTLALLAPDLTICNVGLNDRAGPTSQVSFEASLNLIVDYARLSGDILFCFPNNVNGDTALPTLYTYYQNVAAARSVPMIDIRTLLGTYAVANAAGDMAGPADGVHPSAQGYAKIGAFEVDRITN